MSCQELFISSHLPIVGKNSKSLEKYHSSENVSFGGESPYFAICIMWCMIYKQRSGNTTKTHFLLICGVSPVLR